MEKRSVLRLPYLFAHLHLLSSYSFSSTLLSSNLSLLSASSLLCFSSVHIVGSLTSKLPSITYLSIEHIETLCLFDILSPYLSQVFIVRREYENLYECCIVLFLFVSLSVIMFVVLVAGSTNYVTV